MADTRQVLIFGLDGATFDLMDEWLSSGRLNYFDNLIENGSRANLKSTIPPVTGPAWASFQTGVNPGKHGIFDWGSSEKDTYGEGVVDSTHIKTHTIWELLSKRGYNVGSVGVPVTYPPRAVNGFVTTSLLTPPGAEDYIYPQNLKEGLKKRVDKYIPAPTHAEMAVNTTAWIRELKNSIDNRVKTASYLLETQDWDLSMVYFMETDTVLHHLYHMLKFEQNDPRGSSEQKSQPVVEIFSYIEKGIKKIINQHAHKETTIILVSDHGFGPLEWIFNVNSWLLKEGYLTLKRSVATKIKRLAQKLGFNQRNFYNIGNFLGPLGRGMKWDMDRISGILGRMFLSMDDVDWSKTKAFSRGGVTGSIRLNLKGREPEGSLTEKEARSVKRNLIEDLQNFESPFTGEPVIEKVMLPENIYSGPQSDLGPDLLFTTNGMRTDTGGLTVFKTLDPIIPAFAISGTHRMNGIFVGNGPNLKKRNEIREMKIIDALPSLLYLLDEPIPDYMDGKVCQQLFTDEFNTAHTIRSCSIDMESKQAKPSKTLSDKEITERLKKLGYIA